MDLQIEPYFSFVIAALAFVVCLDRLVLRKRRLQLQVVSDAARHSETQVSQEPVREPWLIEQVNAIFPVLLFVWLFRSFVLEPFQIPSSSMEPTLDVGDFIVVNKYAYGVRSPVTHGVMVHVGMPERGDVAVFIPPVDERYFIKRIVGLPGDLIAYRDKRLYINGEAVEVEITEENRAVVEFQEFLGETPHKARLEKLTRFDPMSGRIIGEGEWTVPEGHYFVMGDNRDNSHDSRAWSDHFVSSDLLIGKAVAVWMHWRSWRSLPDFTKARPIE